MGLLFRTSSLALLLLSVSADAAIQMPFAFWNASGPAWPKGTLGDLTINSGQTTTLSANTVYDYNNITINSGGTLKLNGCDFAYVGVKGNMVNNGTVIAQQCDNNASAYSITRKAPDDTGVANTTGETLTLSGNAQSGGNGGNSVGGCAGEMGSGTVCGNGGGGAEGDDSYDGYCHGGTPSAPTCSCGGNGALASAQPSPAQGSCSFGGNGGTPDSTYGAGDGGGGGHRGYSGGGLWFKIWGNLSGSGSWILYGQKGGNGGNGMGGPYSYGAGGGGAGAGGNGGSLYIRIHGTNNALIPLSVADGGAPGSVGGGAGTSSANGGGGSTGKKGVSSITSY